MKNTVKAVIGVWLMFALWMPTAYAVQVRDLDKTSVSVNSRSQAELNAALKQGFQQIILKNSGSLEALKDPLISSRANAPRSLVRQFGYQDLNGQLMVNMSFDITQIEALLRQAQQPVWGAQRPLTLIWLLDEDEQGLQSIVADSSTSQASQELLSRSDTAGLPILLPLMDLDDSIAIGANDIKGQFADAVANASQRYQTDFFAMASVQSFAGGITYQLSLYPKQVSASGFVQSVLQIQQEASDKQQAIAQMMDAITAFYVSRYAVAGEASAGQVLLSFANVSQLASMVELEKYLQSLALTKGLTMNSMENGQITYRVDLFGSTQELQQQLSLDGRLQQQDAPSNLQPSFELPNQQQGEQTMEAAPLEHLYYRWRG
ncbi:DUF2066 domain-containing protein [Paraferrimonas haliotis]|uniref:DUF2066 domain-containing protein n=1 Tax=Paraferrimonas haliotis TaxID=2013866 RepID=A0AA37U0E7_9GAMM|nr:DUF2066 domain-containing protein [Paraferrimonas haliotis]GLS84266.1 hypothetical protein GCM10007894_22430 [Paraferrimonas haliotis]